MNRQQLSYRVCEHFDRRKRDGSLKDTSCQVALLRMHREGLIELPSPRTQGQPQPLDHVVPGGLLNTRYAAHSKKP